MTVAIGSIAFLLVWASEEQYQSYDFRRLGLSNRLTLINFKDLGYNSYYIAGATDRYTYLGNSVSPLHLLVIDVKTVDTTHVGLDLSSYEGLARGPLSVMVRDDELFLLGGDTRSVLKGTTGKWQLKPFLNGDITTFDQATPSSTGSVFFRTIRGRKYVLGHQDSLSLPATIKYDLLRSQKEGIFEADGLLACDAESSKLIYTYRYRNEFVCMDTSLTLLYRQHTIDPIDTARIQVSELRSGRSMMAIPPLTVNRMCYANAGKLWVVSAIMGAGERVELFKTSTAIDVYDIDEKGRYLYSFYVPYFRSKQLKSFAVKGNRLLAIHDRYFVEYQLGGLPDSVSVPNYDPSVERTTRVSNSRVSKTNSIP